MKVPFHLPDLGPAEAAAAAEAVASRWVVGGPRLAELERQFADRCGVDHAVGVSSWTTGAFLALHALGLGPGDEVLVPSLTFIASVNVIRHVGATPVFVDVDPQTYNIDVDDIEHRITPHTKAIIPIDQLGMPCRIDRIMDIANRHGLFVLQDAACSIGSSYQGLSVGATAPISIFSLHARKVVTTGEGGMIVTNDGDLASRLKRLRHQGMSISDYERRNASVLTFEEYPEVGFNFRITDIQAAVGVEQMRRLDQMVERRRIIAARYRDAFAEHRYLIMPVVEQEAEPNWQSFQVRVRPNAPRMRDDWLEILAARGVGVKRGLMASHLELPYAGTARNLPHTEAAAHECLLLPLYSTMLDEQIDYVIDAVNSFTV